MQPWQRGIGILTGIYVTRLLGMFMLFPVFSAYARSLAHADPATIGIALGAYGLSQGALQIVFGRLSDRYGRRRLIIIGLLIFALGSLLAAAAVSIEAMILARLVQGLGAVSAVTLAYASDISPPDKLGRSMAIIGGSIGLAFVLALALAPALEAVLGVPGIFRLLALLALLAAAAALALPALPPPLARADGGERFDRGALATGCGAVFLLHFLFTGSFVVLPTLWEQLQLSRSQVIWGIYLASNLLALGAMRHGKTAPALLSLGLDYLLFCGGFLLLSLSSGFLLALAAAAVYFVAFYRLETGLPHFVSALATPAIRGRLMGYFTTSQFIGSFVGAGFTGFVWKYFEIKIVLIILAFIAGLGSLILFKLGKNHVR